MTEACCTCAALLSSIPLRHDEKTEKPWQYERRLECCGRTICARCITDNRRFSTYCPFCQVSFVPSPLPQGIRDPPAYSPAIEGEADDDLPPYSQHVPMQTSEKEKSGDAAPDVLHFVDANNDSLPSLSIRYGVPADALRRTNGLYADHLLAARRTILIPGDYYKGGVSLSPRPLEGEEEEIRKGKVRKLMVGCKLAEYDVALVYLQQADYELDKAIAAYKADEKWEKEHPLQAIKKGKSKVSSAGERSNWRGGSGGLTSQI